MSTNTLYNYWGKLSDDYVSCHLLVYHCLDVAAVGQVLLQQTLQQDDYEDILTKNITHDKKISLSLITFFLTMHDLGKFSERFQNTNRDAVNKVHGRLSDKPYTIEHCNLGFCLCQKEILPNVVQKNWLSLDQNTDKFYLQDVLKSWCQSVTMHHERPINIDFQHKPDNLMHFTDENKAAASSFVQEAAKLLLEDFKLKTLKLELCKSLFENVNYIQMLLWYLTVRSDRLVSSSPEYFPPCLMHISIEHYWEKALRNAKSAVKHAEISSSEIINNNQGFFFRKFDLIEGLTLINKAKDDYIPNLRIDEARECYHEAIELFKKTNAEDLLNKYGSELRRLESKNDNSFSNPAKTVTSENPTNKNKISKDHVDEKLNRCLFEILRNLRIEIACKENVPPCNIFHDEKLEAMATVIPQELEDFKKITGACKNYEKYGESFFEKIVIYCKVQETNSERCYSTKLQETLNLCKQNLTLKEIVQKRNLEVNIIIRHIEELILCGAEISIDKFVSAKKQKHIMSAIMKTLSNRDCKKLAPSISDIKKKLGEKSVGCFKDEEICFVRANKIRNDK